MTLIYSSDPLFQHTLVRVVRRYQFTSALIQPPKDPNGWTGLPVLFDEVFTGLYRLGRFSSASFLQCHPDISVHAKLLTGGLLPLSATCASNSIFDAFWGDEKSDALLHGHSYTAHPIGCHIANKSLYEMQVLSQGGVWKSYQRNWQRGDTANLRIGKFAFYSNEIGTWSMWCKNAVLQLSNHPRVESVVALGSVLAVSITDRAGSGNSSLLIYELIAR